MRMIPQRYLPKLPPYWRENDVGYYHYSTTADEADYQREKMDDLHRQRFITTATWGLLYWEYMFQVKPKPGDSYETRRARIISKYRKRNPFTPAEAIEQTNLFITPDAKGKVEVDENSATGEFMISIPLRSLLDLQGWIEDMERRKRVPHVFIPNLYEGGELQLVTGYNRTYVSDYRYCGTFWSGGDWLLC